jgi:hypothetical protein
MALSSEAVLDHFMTSDAAAPGMRSPMHGQLVRAEVAMVDSEGKKVSLPGKNFVALGDEMFVRDDARPDPHAQTDRLHDDMLKAAERDRCARAFRDLTFVPGSVDVLRKVARRLRMPEGQVAARVLAEYQSWSAGDTLKGRLGDRALAKEKADRGLEAIAVWFKSVAGDVGGTEAWFAELYADARLALDAFVTSWSRERKRERGVVNGDKRTRHSDTWMPLSEAAHRSGIGEATLREQCARGDLPARKRDGARGPTWWINLTACANECEDADASSGSVDFLIARLRCAN